MVLTDDGEVRALSTSMTVAAKLLSARPFDVLRLGLIRFALCFLAACFAFFAKMEVLEIAKLTFQFVD